MKTIIINILIGIFSMTCFILFFNIVDKDCDTIIEILMSKLFAALFLIAGFMSLIAMKEINTKGGKDA